jgi:hypothetical protein
MRWDGIYDMKRGVCVKNKSIFTIVVALLVIVIILAYVNKQNMKVTGLDAIDGKILITAGGQEKKLEFQDIKALNPIKFKAIQDTSKGGPEEHEFKGVLLKDVISKAFSQDELKKCTKVIVKAIDGYTVALSPEEVMATDNVYLAFEKDGEPLKSKVDGGSGPYQVIIRKDEFSQRWCKFVTEVSLQ